MRQIFILVIVFSLRSISFSQTGSVGIGTTTPHSSAALDVQSTDKGMLVPRMTTTQRTAISNAATGLLVFDNTTGTFWFYNGSAWMELTGGGNGNWSQSGNNIYNSNAGNVGIGVTNPSYRLSLKGGIGLYNNEGAYGYIQNSGVSHSNLIGNLSINADAGNLLNQTPAHDIILQYATGSGVTSGNVGIGTDNPTEKLDINGNVKINGNVGIGINEMDDDAKLHLFDNGPTRVVIGGSHVGGGYTSIYLGTSAITNGYSYIQSVKTAGSLWGDITLNPFGGNVGIGTSSPSQKLEINGNVKVGALLSNTTGTANLLPICYGVVDADGTVLSGTGNFTVQKVYQNVAGIYSIQISGITINPDNAVVLVTPVGFGEHRSGIVGPGTIGGDFEVVITNDVSGNSLDTKFHFIVYKP